MSTGSYKDISNVVRISTEFSLHCKFCNFVGPGTEIDSLINHYLKEHDYKLIHVGTESVPHTGEAYYATVAVLGK